MNEEELVRQAAEEWRADALARVWRAELYVTRDRAVPYDRGDARWFEVRDRPRWDAIQALLNEGAIRVQPDPEWDRVILGVGVAHRLVIVKVK